MRKRKLKVLCSLLILSISVMGMTACQTVGSKKTDESKSEVVSETDESTTEVVSSNEAAIEDFQSWSTYSTEYLNELKDTYQLEDLTKGCKSDFDKVETITKWVSGLWKHNGENEPEQYDPLYILDQVINNGKQYRCVEYGIVIDGCLKALGLDSRELGLKMKDVETIEVGAGHVGCEVFLNDIKKWAFIDGQWGAIPMLGDTPLNAYEFGEAIGSKNPDLHIDWVNNVYGASDSAYYDWIEPYLFYLDASYLGTDGTVKAIMYVPETGKEVTIFQIEYPIKMDYYTRDIEQFYLGQKEILK